MIVSLDLHDFSLENNYAELLLKVKEKFPNFKVSLFTIPIDVKNRHKDREKGLKFVKENLDWIRLIPHGLCHNSAEARNWSSTDFRYAIVPAIERAFDGLPFEKGFCPPHWKWSNGVVKALDALGWWGAVKEGMVKPKKYYQFSHSINNIDYSQPVLKLHGHLNDTSPDRLSLCLDNILKLPQAEWKFI